MHSDIHTHPESENQVRLLDNVDLMESSRILPAKHSDKYDSIIFNAWQLLSKILFWICLSQQCTINTSWIYSDTYGNNRQAKERQHSSLDLKAAPPEASAELSFIPSLL